MRKSSDGRGAASLTQRCAMTVEQPLEVGGVVHKQCKRVLLVKMEDEGVPSIAEADGVVHRIRRILHQRMAVHVHMPYVRARERRRGGIVRIGLEIEESV